MGGRGRDSASVVQCCFALCKRGEMVTMLVQLFVGAGSDPSFDSRAGVIAVIIAWSMVRTVSILRGHSKRPPPPILSFVAQLL